MTVMILTPPAQSTNVATALVKEKNGKKVKLSVTTGNGESSVFDFEIGTPRAPVDVQGQLQNAGVAAMFRVELDARGSKLIQILPDM